jgi:hypothetical protein
MANDSAQFMNIGKAWSIGKIPYRDMFDHKGPLIFFLDMLGFKIGGGSKYGIIIIQAIFMFFTITGIFAISQLARKSNLYGFIAVVITLIVMKINYAEGNSVEEYCLPFLIWSVYGLSSWFKLGGQREHNWHWSVLYGITAGVCIMTRATNIAPICGSIFVISVILLKNKCFKNLIHNVIAFVIGLLIVILPFSIYFGSKGVLYDMFYATILYNIEYSKGCPPWFLSADGNAIKIFLVYYFVYYIIFIIVGIKILHKEYTQAIAYFITGLIETYIFMNGYAFIQYPLVCLMQFTLMLNEIIVLLDESSLKHRLLSIMLVCVLSIFLCKLVNDNFISAKNIYNSCHKYTEREWQVLINEIPKDDLSHFVAYGGNYSKELYLSCDIMPCYKYFAIQEWHSKFSNKVRNEIHDTFMDGDAKWILTDGNTAIIDDVLNIRYIMYDHTDNYYLYKRLD